MASSAFPKGGQLLSVLCCMCGVPIQPNPSNTCASCLAARSDVTRGISTEATLHQCRGCQRWHKEAGKWIACELESRELMALCLSNVSGLNTKTSKNDKGEKVRLIDASWIWTEPHSMRLKVRLTIQKEVQTGTILQQSFMVVFVVRNQQCIECQAEFRQGSWKSLVQVRQRVQHKRTFLYLEQLILKHGAHRGCLSIETYKDGMDFYFPDKGKSARFISFIENVVPIKVSYHMICIQETVSKMEMKYTFLIQSICFITLLQVKYSKKLISTDDKSNISNYKFTNLVEICLLCKDDLLYLPKKVANNLGNISRTVLVKNISNLIHFIDPFTGQIASMPAEMYWRDPMAFRPIVTAARSRFTRFVILGKEPVVLQTNVSKKSTSKQRNRLAHVTVAREADLGANDAQDEVNSHVGYLLKAGDVCVGYDLKEVQLVDDEAESVRGTDTLPNTILLRKLYGGVATEDVNAAKQRIFRVERLDTVAGEENERKSKKDLANEDMDEEDFMQEIEADKEMRNKMNLYKAAHVANKKKEDMDMGDDDDEDDDQKIDLDELLDGLVLNDGPDKKSEPMQEFDEDAPWGLKNTVEEGEKAAKDGINYVGRDAARQLKDKESATTVSQFGEEFMNKKFNFL